MWRVGTVGISAAASAAVGEGGRDRRRESPERRLCRRTGRSRSCRGCRGCTMKGGTRVAGADPVLREGSARCCDESPSTAPLLRRRRTRMSEEEPLLESERDKRRRRSRPSLIKFRRTEAAETSRTPLLCLFNLVLGGDSFKPSFWFWSWFGVFLLLVLVERTARQPTEQN